MSNRALLGLILREMLLNNMLTAEVILEMEEHNHLLKQVNTTKVCTLPLCASCMVCLAAS